MADAPPLDPFTNAPPSSSAAAVVETLAPVSSDAMAAASHHSKRQRRPSVRLGDPGEQLSSPLSSLIKPLHTWRSSKSRQPTHLPSSSAVADVFDDEDHPISVSFRRGPRDSKHKKSPTLPTTKGIRSNWTSPRVDGAVPTIPPLDSRSLSPSDNEADDRDLIENGVHSNDNDNSNGGGGSSEEDDDVIGGVRLWLNRLGLGRYAPVFEIHEVDDEVLPMLTLEDLKDMGINAVGSRRKMYCAIQKLKKSLQ